MLTNMVGMVYVNGVITPADAAVIPVFDHGFLYGEGVYETLRTYGRQPFAFEAHMARLRRSAAMIALPVPMSDADLAAAVADTGRDVVSDELYIRMLLTRGVGDLTYQLSATPVPSLVIIVKPLKPFPAAHYTDGISLALSPVRRNHPDALTPLVKSNNLMNTALAMQAVASQGVDEAVLLNQAGHVTECSQSNLFLVMGGTLVTPELAAGLLPGITRQLVIELARAAGVAVEERIVRPEELATADELFITSTTREIAPATRLNGAAIGTGRPGPVTTLLRERFVARVTAR